MHVGVELAEAKGLGGRRASLATLTRESKRGGRSFDSDRQIQTALRIRGVVSMFSRNRLESSAKSRSVLRLSCSKSN
jgi:hypothetical protein